MEHQRAKVRRDIWFRRVMFSLAVGILFGLLIPTWENLQMLGLSVGLLSAVFLVVHVVRDRILVRKFLDEWEARTDPSS